MYELRPYQKEAVKAIFSEWVGGHQRTLLVLPTGTGKTVVFAKVVELKVGEGNTAISTYETKLIDKKLLQKKLIEYQKAFDDKD